LVTASVDDVGVARLVIFFPFQLVFAVGTPVPSRKMQLDSAVAISSSCVSSFDISIGELACSETQLYSLLNTPVENGIEATPWKSF
jgi:hypothetical protein